VIGPERAHRVDDREDEVQPGLGHLVKAPEALDHHHLGLRHDADAAEDEKQEEGRDGDRHR
jgi:hypothetical protein